MTATKIIVGGGIEEDLSDFLDAWTRAERGEHVAERSLAFDDWETLARVMTPERYRMLRHLRAHPEPSVRALSRSLDRQYRRVHDDVVALARAGLIERDNISVRAAVDTIHAEIRL